jgi:hypothetical protein
MGRGGGRVVRLRIGGRVIVRRRVENHAVERINRGIELLVALGLNRRSKYSKGKAQDCKTLHRGSPNLMCVRSAGVLASLGTAGIGAEGGVGTTLVLFRGVS